MSNEEVIIVLRDTARNNVNTVHIACMIGIDAIKENEQLKSANSKLCEEIAELKKEVIKKQLF